MSERRPSPNEEGGLRAPPGLSTLGKIWWWFHFLILVKIARLRFIAVLVVIGLAIVKWDTLVAYYERWTRPAAQVHAAGADFEFYCPMHPTVVRDNNKEKCPICFMPLSKRKKGTDTDVVLPPGVVNRVQLAPYRVVQAGIQTWKVTHVPLHKEIRTVGFIEFNEREMKQVSARVKGRLDAVYVNETGRMVQAGEVLASLYSPELVVTVQNLLDAHRQNNAPLMNIARDRLLLWGISEEQIQQILKTQGTPSANNTPVPFTHLKIHSPIHGHVLKKYVKEGQYVDEGMPLYDVVDLSTVWIQAQVFEDDMAFLPSAHSLQHASAKRPEDALLVSATSRAFPGETFTGRLSFVFPHVDLETRTLVARYELDNPDHKLRPGTTVSTSVKIPAERSPVLVKAIHDRWLASTAVATAMQSLINPFGGPRLDGLGALIEAAGETAVLQQGLVLAVPEGAVIDTGALKIVYRELIPGEYEGVRVHLGPRMTGPEGVLYYPVLHGLAAGDSVVTAGAFLLDAETRLNPAVGSIYFGGSGGSGGSKSAITSAGVKPSTPEDEEAKIKAALARLPQRDRALAEAQKFCPIQKGSRLGSMGVPMKVMLLGQPVFLCCHGCENAALENPQQTLQKVEELKKR